MTTAYRVGRYIRSKDHVTLIALALLGAGLILRLWHFASGRSLWLDEAMVASSILQRDWSGLFAPLDYEQVAPIGWLLIEKAALQSFGGLEYILRLPQLIFGLAALALFAVTARRTFAGPGFVTAIALFALGSGLVFFTAEVKPYGDDVFFSVVFLFFGVRYFLQQAPITTTGLFALAIVGVAAIACSLPAVVIMACFGPLILLREVVQRRLAAAISVAIVGVIWLGTFAYIFLSLYKLDSSTMAEMSRHWQGGFAPLPPTSFTDLKWYWKEAAGLFEFMFGSASTIAAVIAAAIGGWMLVRKNPLFGALLLAPFPVAFIVSGLHLYPIGDRLSLYLAPQLIFLVAAGVQAVVSTVRPGIAATLIATALVVAGSADKLWQNFTYFPLPYAPEHIRPVLEEVAARITPGQSIYVDRSALPAFRIYQERTGLGGADVVEGKFPSGGDLGCLLEEIDSIRSHDQIWVVFSHSNQVMSQPKEDVFMYFARIAGKEIFSRRSASVRVSLFEFEASGGEVFTPLLRALPPQVPCEQLLDTMQPPVGTADR